MKDAQATGALKRDHPALLNMKILFFSHLFLWAIFAFLDLDPDPDQEFECGSGSSNSD
jgi:hypothetical protein